MVPLGDIFLTLMISPTIGGTRGMATQGNSVTMFTKFVTKNHFFTFNIREMITLSKHRYISRNGFTLEYF